MDDLIAQIRDAHPTHEAAWTGLFDACDPWLLEAAQAKMHGPRPCDARDYVNDVFHRLAVESGFPFANAEELETYLLAQLDLVMSG